MDFEAKGQKFWQWLETNGAVLSDGIAFKDYRESDDAGRGVVATRDIKEGEVLFSIPRSLLLSSQSSMLRKQEGMADILDGMSGWSPLILCLMYESQREDSFWKPYFDVLPTEFSTPMFWSAEDLEELKGTDVIDKIGKEDAEAMFQRELEPIIKGHPNIFDVNAHNVELFHRCGSLIMAYSFHDELTPAKTVKRDSDGAAEAIERKKETDENDEEEEEEEEEEEQEGLLAMVPMADMLNHKTGFNNARLFHEPEGLLMKAIKPIKEGEQIYNTYGDLCNADLLRKYGFADENNPHDIVEINGEAVVDTCCQDMREQKIEFLMEEDCLDDCFVINTEHELPPELISAMHVLRASAVDFERMESKQKLPKPKLTPEVTELGIKLLQQRLEQYPTSLQDDVAQLQQCRERNKRHALLVRTGEKQILQATLSKLKAVGSKRAAAGDSADEAKAQKRRRT